jgi:hypothetical protein
LFHSYTGLRTELHPQFHQYQCSLLIESCHWDSNRLKSIVGVSERPELLAGAGCYLQSESRWLRLQIVDSTWIDNGIDGAVKPGISLVVGRKFAMHHLSYTLASFNFLYYMIQELVSR